MTGWAWLDGRVVPEREARVSIWDRGFLYGDGVFETLRVYGGRPFQLDAHLARLQRGLERLRIADAPDPGALRGAVDALLGRVAGAEAVLRIVVTRGRAPGGWRGGSAGGPTVLVVLREYPLPPAAWYETGATAVWCETPMMRAAWWPSDVKHNNWLPRILAQQQVDAAGADEGFLRAETGHLVEGLTSNVFVVRDETLATPPLQEGALPGVTRAVVLRAAATAGIAARETPVPTEAVESAEELFYTNAGLGPVAVATFAGRPVGRGRPGPVWRALHAAYFAEARP